MALRPGNRGFTIIEMAIVLLILGLLLGGGLAVLSTQVEIQKVKDTQRLLDEAREALLGFAVRNGRLPCPANPALAAGTELPACAGPTLQGVLPWATLGIAETDAWGRRFTYRVSAVFARPVPQGVGFGCTPTPVPTRASFALCSPGDMNVLTTTAGAALATTIPAVVVSHGPNGRHAFLPSGGQMAASPDPDETQNFAGVATDFVSKTPTATYDDLIVWVTPNILANRMLQAGRLP